MITNESELSAKDRQCWYKLQPETYFNEDVQLKITTPSLHPPPSPRISYSDRETERERERERKKRSAHSARVRGAQNRKFLEKHFAEYEIRLKR